jgi:hypothetical protein
MSVVGDITSGEVHTLRSLLLDGTVPTEAAVLVAKLIDHCGTLERQISLMRGGFESACRALPANAVHDVAPFNRKPRKS